MEDLKKELQLMNDRLESLSRKYPNLNLVFLSSLQVKEGEETVCGEFYKFNPDKKSVSIMSAMYNGNLKLLKEIRRFKIALDYMRGFEVVCINNGIPNDFKDLEDDDFTFLPPPIKALNDLMKQNKWVEVGRKYKVVEVIIKQAFSYNMLFRLETLEGQPVENDDGSIVFTEGGCESLFPSHFFYLDIEAQIKNN